MEEPFKVIGLVLFALICFVIFVKILPQLVLGLLILASALVFVDSNVRDWVKDKIGIS